MTSEATMRVDGKVKTGMWKEWRIYILKAPIGKVRGSGRPLMFRPLAAFCPAAFLGQVPAQNETHLGIWRVCVAS